MGQFSMMASVAGNYGALRRRRLLSFSGAAAGLALLPRIARAETGIILNDASRLNATRVARHVILRPDAEVSLIADLRSELRDAAAVGRPVALGVARHSMGGQSLAIGATALTFEGGQCIPDTNAGLYRAKMGARWRDVIRTLDPIGWSPAVMQSNNDFGVASTFSVNAHGWPVPHGPFGTTVRQIRLMLADGELVTCSATENAALFRLAMGGYGLAGIVVDVDVAMLPNRLLTPHFEVIPSADFAEHFLALCTNPAVSMAYGRVEVAAHAFLEQAMAVAYHTSPQQPAALPPAPSEWPTTGLARRVYRAQTGSEIGKRLRWFLETEVAPGRLEGDATRNALLNEPVANLASGDPTRTDILHEYFIPPKRLADFLGACREVLPRFHQDLLNVTLRYVEADPISLLAYAPGPRISAVMSFSQVIDSAAEADMRAMTQALVDRVLELSGSFYLPYRLHARLTQMRRAYINVDAFAEAKRQADPKLLFRNVLWDRFLSPLSQDASARSKL
jgi:FAD/FMN-containing dehydrogenase